MKIIQKFLYTGRLIPTRSESEAGNKNRSTINNAAAEHCSRERTIQDRHNQDQIISINRKTTLKIKLRRTTEWN